MCVIARVFRKTRDGQVVQLQQGVIIGAQARAAVAYEMPEEQGAAVLAKKRLSRTPYSFGETVTAFASSNRRCGQRTCRVPSLVR
jgi:hypothetical protein